MAFKHGLRDHPLYKKRLNIIDRCENKKYKGYSRYGGRGITICPEWRNSFLSFYTWAINNGWKNGFQIDRINNDCNYEPSNCRFVTSIENNRNKCSNKLVVYNGQTKSLAEWCEIFNVSYNQVASRLLRQPDLGKVLKSKRLKNYQGTNKYKSTKLIINPCRSIAI